MKKIITIISLLGLTACTMPTDDMLNNKFVSISPQPLGNVYTESIWTGNNGPYLITLILHNDGTGVMCSSYQTRNSLEKTKYNDGILYDQSGGRTKLSLNGNNLIGNSPYFGAKTIIFYRDNDLKEASIYCKKAIESQVLPSS